MSRRVECLLQYGIMYNFEAIHKQRFDQLKQSRIIELFSSKESVKRIKASIVRDGMRPNTAATKVNKVLTNFCFLVSNLIPFITFIFQEENDPKFFNPSVAYLSTSYSGDTILLSFHSLERTGKSHTTYLMTLNYQFAVNSSQP